MNKTQVQKCSHAMERSVGEGERLEVVRSGGDPTQVGLLLTGPAPREATVWYGWDACMSAAEARYENMYGCTEVLR